MCDESLGVGGEEETTRAHHSSGTRGSISPKIRRELASVFDWMEPSGVEQEMEPLVPLWFQNYMENFKDDLVAEVTSKVVQSLGVVLDNKLSKLKLQNNNNSTAQSRSKMSTKEVFQMKRRRERRLRAKSTTGLSDFEKPDSCQKVTTDKEEDNTEVEQEDKCVPNKEVSVDKTVSHVPPQPELEEEAAKQTPEVVKSPEAVAKCPPTAAPRSQRPGCRARPFLRQARGHGAVRNFMKECNVGCNTRIGKKNDEHEKSGEVHETDTSVEKCGNATQNKQDQPPTASATRKGVKELTKQIRSSRGKRSGRKHRMRAARNAAATDTAASGDNQTDYIRDASASLSKRRKSEPKTSLAQGGAGGRGVMGGAPTTVSRHTSTTNSTSRHNFILNRQRRRKMKLMAERSLAAHAPVSSSDDKCVETTKLKQDRAVVLKEKYKVIPVKDNYPLTPVKDYPLTVVKDYPIITRKDYPLQLSPTYPVTSVKDYPITPALSLQPDFLDKIIGVVAGSLESGKDSGLNDSVAESECESTSSGSSEFHTGCSEDPGSSSEDSYTLEDDEGYVPLLAKAIKHPDAYITGKAPTKLPKFKKPVKASDAMKLLPVAPGSGEEKEGQAVLVKVEDPEKAGDQLTVQYEVKAGQTFHTDVKVCDIPEGRYKYIQLEMVRCDPGLRAINQQKPVLYKENLKASSSQQQLSFQAPEKEGIYECVYKLKSSGGKKNKHLKDLALKYKFHVKPANKDKRNVKVVGEESPAKSKEENKKLAKDKKSEVKVVKEKTPDQEFEEALEALEDTEVLETGEKFDEFHEVCVGPCTESEYEVVGFRTLESEGEVFTQCSAEAQLDLAEELLGIQEDQDKFIGDKLEVELEVVPLGRSRSNSFDFVEVGNSTGGTVSPFQSVGCEQDK